MVGDLGDLGPFVADAARVLRPGGHLIYSDFHPSWSIRGWRRTFRAKDGTLHEVSYVPHALDGHLSALQTGGFDLVTLREPRLDTRSELALVVVHAVKRGAPSHVRHRR
jgi:malonyl-CoA O-methyltransferase